MVLVRLDGKRSRTAGRERKALVWVAFGSSASERGGRASRSGDSWRSLGGKGGKVQLCWYDSGVAISLVVLVLELLPAEDVERRGGPPSSSIGCFCWLLSADA